MKDLFLVRSPPLGKKDNPVAQFLRLLTYAQPAEDGSAEYRACAAFTEEGDVAFFLEREDKQS